LGRASTLRQRSTHRGPWHIGRQRLSDRHGRSRPPARPRGPASPLEARGHSARNRRRPRAV